MAKINLEKLSLDELNELQKNVTKAIANFEDRKRAEAKKALELVAKEHGMSLEAILGGKKKRKVKAPVAPKYRNPQNTDETWSGRGRQPAWFKSALAKGTKPEKMEI